MTLHPKILELRNSVGSSPIKYAYRKKALNVPEAARAKQGTFDEDGERVLKQYFCIWGEKDDYGTIPMRGMWEKTIKERGPKSKATFKVVPLYMHSQRDTVGTFRVLEEDEIGLYGEVVLFPKGEVQVADELLTRHRSKACNNGSYGFDYVWDKMKYDESVDAIRMYEIEGYEGSFVTIGSQTGTYGVRDANGVYTDEFINEDTEDLFKKIPRSEHLALRSLIDRHITLAKSQPLEPRQKALEDSKPQHGGVNYNYLLSKF